MSPFDNKLVLIPLFFVACQAPVQTEAEARSAIEIPTSCPGTRYIGMVPPDKTCPIKSLATDPWVGGKLFDMGTAPDELAQYCVYDWNRSGLPREDWLPRHTPSIPGIDWLESDCYALNAFGHPFEEAAASKLVPSFYEQMQLLSPLPSQAMMASATKVVIVDSAVNETFPDPGTGRYEHGEMMGLVVRQLACPVTGTPCVAQVSSALALPIVKTATGLVRDEAFGGTLGGFGDMARAIYNGFEHARQAPGDDRIIINLSVGWARRFGGAFSGSNWMSLPRPVRAVFSAITYVNCKNGIVIAAAGNNPEGGITVPGAAFPAAWEEKPAPGVARCSRLGGGAPMASVSPYRPIVYAASGVDWIDQPLVGTRVGGIAQVVAPAAHTAFSNANNETQVYVGSSLAAANLSAVAAAVWTYLPTMPPHDVLDLVIDHGYDMTFAPDFCIENTNCRTHAKRISMCKAVEAACASNGSCTLNMPCPDRDAETDSRATGLDFSGIAVDLHVDARQMPQYFGLSPADEYTTQFAEPLSHPQPPDPICPMCTLKLNEVLLLGINKQPAELLAKPTIKVIVNGVEEVYELSISDADLNSMDVISVEGLPFNVEDVSEGSIEFLLDGDLAISDQLFIEKP